MPPPNMTASTSILPAIPADFSYASDEPFDQRYMIALFNRGYSLGAHQYSWSKARRE